MNVKSKKFAFINTKKMIFLSKERSKVRIILIFYNILSLKSEFIFLGVKKNKYLWNRMFKIQTIYKYKI
jgi:hypothetical protein